MQKKTFWPFGILIALFAIVCACVATIIFASNYPVFEADNFLGKYQEVDKNFNELASQNEHFRANFKVALNGTAKFHSSKKQIFELGDTAELEFIVIQEGNLSANAIKPTLLLTRPHTNADDKWLEASAITPLKNENSPFDFYTFSAKLPQMDAGRWQVKLKAEFDADTIGFYEFELVKK